MKKFYLIILYCIIFGTGSNVFAQVNGCTDPQANNYNASATINDGSCTYNVTNLTLTDKTPLSTPLLDETSGLEFLSNKLWTFTDSGNPNAIYRIDTASNTVYQTVTISNATNVDWEDMTSNNDYLFIGDFGNNNGNRQNLKIYRINKNNLSPGVTSANADIINFSFSDQTTFTSLPNNNNFDCESMIFYNDSIHLFSKNWVNKQTRHYVLPNIPGTQVAQYRETLNAGFLVTSASVQKGGVIALIGYENTGSVPVYLYMLYDHKNNFFFNGNKRKFNVGNMTTYGQVEGVEFFNAAYAYITNEKYTNGSTIPPKLRTLNLTPYLPNEFVYPKPKTQFSANTTAVCANASITFADQSENDPISWQWSFPGGNPSTSTLQNPQVQYPAGGTYSVTLIAGNATGNETLVKSNYITVNANPVPSISGNTSFCPGSSTTLNAGAGYSSYLWSTGATTQSITVNTVGTFTVTVTNTNGCTGSTSVNAVINTNPTPSISGVTSFCTGGSTTLNAGTGYSNYLWSTGATTQSINVNTAGTFTVTVTNANGCTGITSTTTTVNTSFTPTVTGSTSFCSGGSTTLDAGAGYNGYLWSTGTTTQSINISTAGTFTVTVTNANGCTGTATATTTVSTSFTPTIAGNTSFCSGGSTTLDAGTGYSSYLWSTGATTQSINVNTAGTFTVTVTNANGCTGTTSATASVGTFTASVLPSGTVTLCSGSGTTLSATAGTGYTYQWYRNNVLLSATTQTYTTSTQGTYKCVVTSGTCSATTGNVVIVVNTTPAATVSYSTPLSFCSPGSVTFTANALSGAAYQWENNSVAISGATAQTYVATTAGAYRVKETRSGCIGYSSVKTVTAATSATAAISTTDPTTQCTGGIVNMSITGPVPGYTYQWKKNTVNIAGATGSTYAATTTGSYTVTATASCGTATSNAIAVTIGSVSAVVTPSGTATLCSGSTLTLAANTGTGYGYQWKNNNVNITGATAATYTVTTGGSYTVAITSPCGNATSAATVVTQAATVTAALTPSGSSTVCSGSSITLTANAGTGYTYRWYRNNVLLTPTTQTFTTSTAGSYKVEVSISGSCAVQSNTSIITVTNNPTATVTAGGPTTFCAGQSVTFTANTYAGVTQQWQKNSVNIAGATNQTYTATTGGNYRVQQTANGCTKNSAQNAVTVNCRVGDDGVEIGSDETGTAIQLNVYPNPFEDKLNIEIASEQNEAVEIKVMDVLGKVQCTQLITTNKTTELNTQLPAGIYMINAFVDGQMKTVRVVKTK